MEATKYYNPITGSESFFLNEQQAKNEGYTQLAASSGTLTSDMFKGSPSANFQTPNYSSVYPVGGLGQFSLSQPEQKAQSMFDKAQELNKSLQGESAFKAEQQQAFDISGLTKTQKDLQAKVKALQNEALAIPLQLQQNVEGKGVTKGGLAPIEAGALRTNAIAALSNSALLEAANGNLTLAMDQVDQAVAQKFNPIKEEIAVTMANLELVMNSPEYTNAQKEKAQAQLDIQKQKENDIKKQEDSSKIAQAMAAAAITNNPDNQGALMAAQELLKLDPADPNYLSKAFGLVGKYQTDPIATQKAILDNQKSELELKKLNAEIAKINKEAQGIGVPQITNLDSAQYGQAINVILGSGKFTKEQKADFISSINNGEDPFIVVKNKAKDIMGSVLAKELSHYETARAQMQSIESLLNDYYANGGETSFLTGTYEKVENKIGLVNDPKLVEIAVNIAAALQIYRNAVSGTAYSVQEGKDIASIFPGINKTQGLNKAILAGRMKAFESTIDAQYKDTLGSVYDTLKSTQRSSLAEKVKSAGYDYAQMKADGFSDEEIKKALNI